jgi:peptide/nickel transport system substrate-binding protein
MFAGAAALLALAVLTPARAAEPKHGGTLVFAVEAEPANYDCHANVSFAFLHPVAPHYSTLLKFDAANYPAVQGDLAESWTVSPDKRVYRFKLKPDIYFHDGTRREGRRSHGTRRDRRAVPKLHAGRA